MTPDRESAPDKRRTWIGSIAIDCSDIPRMLTFWQGALGYVPRDPPTDEYAVLVDPAGQGPNLTLSLSSEGPIEDYRLHLDLYSADPEAEVRRLVRLGATLQRGADPGHDFITLSDPDGNLFDVVFKKGWTHGRRA